MAIQSASVAISNAGGGDLSWQASEDAPWLSLSHDSGDAPDTLTLYVDPGMIELHRTVSTVLSVSVTGSAEAPLEIAVNLSVGDVWRDLGRVQASLGDLAREFGRINCADGDCRADYDRDFDVDGRDVRSYSVNPL